MTWAAGELERWQLFHELRTSRINKRVELELSLAAPSTGPLLAAQANFEALIHSQWVQDLPPEEEFEDSEIVVNQNIY